MRIMSAQNHRAAAEVCRNLDDVDTHTEEGARR